MKRTNLAFGFARFVCNEDPRIGKGLTNCEIWGMTFGCPNCPVPKEECPLKRGIKE